MCDSNEYMNLVKMTTNKKNYYFFVHLNLPYSFAVLSSSSIHFRQLFARYSEKRTNLMEKEHLNTILIYVSKDHNPRNNI